MFTFLSPKTNRKDKVAARVSICLFALLFFLCSLLSALPSFEEISGQFAEYGLAGYAEVSDKRSDRHEEALEQFTDRPFSEGTSVQEENSDELLQEQPTVTEPTVPKESVKIEFSAL